MLKIAVINLSETYLKIFLIRRIERGDEMFVSKLTVFFNAENKSLYVAKSQHHVETIEQLLSEKRCQD